MFQDRNPRNRRHTLKKWFLTVVGSSLLIGVSACAAPTNSSDNPPSSQQNSSEFISIPTLPYDWERVNFDELGVSVAVPPDCQVDQEWAEVYCGPNGLSEAHDGLRLQDTGDYDIGLDSNSTTWTKEAVLDAYQSLLDTPDPNLSVNSVDLLDGGDRRIAGISWISEYDEARYTAFIPLNGRLLVFTNIGWPAGDPEWNSYYLPLFRIYISHVESLR